jgi:hypothetical protein
MTVPQQREQSLLESGEVLFFKRKRLFQKANFETASAAPTK